MEIVGRGNSQGGKVYSLAVQSAIMRETAAFKIYEHR